MRKRNWIYITLVMLLLALLASTDKELKEVNATNYYEDYSFKEQFVLEEIKIPEDEDMLITLYMSSEAMDNFQVSSGDIIELGGSVYRVKLDPNVEPNKVALKKSTKNGEENYIYLKYE